ncbi:MAG: ATP-binding protein [Candidatus Sericytochromatia bacterium]|nr:ATP-binding protein [Candidatus Sericytochromatia bacterium]
MTNETGKKIGIVVGTKDSTPLECWVGIEEVACVQLDDVVQILASNPETGEQIAYYGLVDRVEKTLEGINFHSDSIRVSEGMLPYSLSYLAHVTITRIEPEIYTPPHPGLSVYRASGEAFDDALFFSQMKHRLPAGLLQNGQPAWFNFDFIDGTKGGHVSISGISGVATKTSYTLFLLHGIFNAPSLPESKQRNAHAIIFNVKEEDLLYLDQPNNGLQEKHIAMYKKLGLPAMPFQDVSFYAPCESEKGEMVPATVKQEGVKVYGWSLYRIAKEGLLRFLFNEDDNPSSNLSFVLDRVCERLLELSETADKQVLTTSDGYHQTLKSLQDLHNHLQMILEESEDDECPDPQLANRGKRYWFGSNAGGTIKAFLRRLDYSVQHVKAFVRPDMREAQKVDWQARQLTVIDINQLHAKAQMFVVGSVLKQIFEYKATHRDKQPVFIVLDELNRYAPRSGWSPIKEMLLDIAERGRSMGLILLGAQQTASEVEKRIVSNAAIRVNGRLDGAEASAKEYDYLRGTFKQRAMILRPGSMIIQQPELSSPLMVNVPWPAWATRAAEVDDRASLSKLEQELAQDLDL